jgi:hypothetical protein
MTGDGVSGLGGGLRDSLAFVVLSLQSQIDRVNDKLEKL